MSKNNKIIIAAIAVVALLLVIGALFASGILSGNDDDKNTTSYEVSFIDGDDVIKTLNIKENNLVSRISDPEKKGYIFTGWYSDKELTNEFDFENTRITENTNIYAKWVKASEPEPGDITFTVTFNTDGASSIASQTVKEGEKAVKPADPLKSGYKFEGWYSDSSFTTKFDFKTPITFDITLYAKFTVSQGGGGGGGSITPPPVTDTTYSIIYDGNGNDSGTVPDTQTLSKSNPNVQISDQNSLLRDRYTFVCWNTESDGTGTNYVAGSSISFNDLNSDLTLYAKWAVGTYAVEENQANISIDTTDIDLINELVSKDIIDLADTSNYENVNTINLSKDLLNNVQDKNTDDKDLSVKTAKGSVQLSSEVVDSIIRTSTDDITIKIELESNSETKYSIEITSGGKPIDKFPEAIKISIPYTLKDGENPQDIVVYYINIHKEEHLVHGTYNEKTKCVDILTNHLSNYEIKNDAKYSINFILNGGKFEFFTSSDYVGREFNEIITKPADPLKNGYIFKGWFKDESLTTVWDFNTDTVKTLNKSDPYTINLYAKWEAVSYNIIYNLDGGINSSGNPTSYTIESETITFENPSKTGYTFKGWFFDAEFKNQTTSIVKGSFRDVTLYASWEKNKYSVTLSSGTGYKLNQLQNPSIVEHGGSFQFNLSIYDDFKQSTPVVKSNGKTISAVNEIYTISNITENQIVTVEGIETNTYSITFANEDGFYSVDNSNPVNEGENFTFTITLNDAYNQSILAESSVKVFGKYGSVSKTGENVNQYTITNVTSDLVVLVDGLKKNEYVVTFISDNDIILEQKVSHGDSASLISNLTKPGYEFEGWYLDANGIIEYSNKAITEDTTLYAKWNAGTTNYFIYIYQEKISYTSDANKYELMHVDQISDSVGKTVSVDWETYPMETILGSANGFEINKSKIDEASGIISTENPLILKLYFDRKEFTMNFEVSGGITFEKVSEIKAKYGQPVSPIRVILPEGITLDYWYESDDKTPYLFTTMPDHDVTLHSKFTRIYYLEYNANGGIGDLPYTIGYANEPDVTLFGPNYPTPGSYILTKEGYTFGGWKYGDETYQPGDSFTMPNDDVTLIAVWTPITYKVQFDGNESTSGSMSDQTFTYDKAQDLTANAFVKTGYTFAGWSDTLGGSVKYADSESVSNLTSTEGATVTLYAVWQINQYTITFNSNGGSEVESIAAEYNAHVTLPTPTREGHTFAGWYSDEKLTTEYTSDKMPAENITLYANWTANSYNVTFHYNNGTDDTTELIAFNTSITEPEVSRSGYTLEGWYSDSNFNTKWNFESDKMPSQNIDLYAKWTATSYTVNFYNETELVSSTTYTVESDSIQMPSNPIKTGHTFNGWFDSTLTNEFNYIKGTTVGDLNLYAKFTINQYTITFNSNGGSEVESIAAEYNAHVTLPTPTREGYTLEGWYSDESLDTKYTSDKMPAEDITLYAKWTKNSYTLTINYVYEDGSEVNDPYVNLVEYGETYAVISPSIESFLPDIPTVTGTMPANDLTITVTYGEYLININGTNYGTIEDALASAQEGDRLILLRDYTIQKDLTIPKGILLVLPCSNDDIGYDLTAEYEDNHNPDGTSTNKGDLSVLYRTLTIPSGVTLNIEGQLLVNAVTGRPAAGHYDMDITGGYSQIILEGDIVVQDGAILEVCGIIDGNGRVTAESGSEIRELYVVKNWRGGSQAYRIFPSVFPFNEYDCHSIQAELFIKSGALVSGNVKMYAQNKFVPSSPPQYFYIRFPQIGENGLIQLAADAHLVRTYDADAINGSSDSDCGRTNFEIYGGATFSHSTLKIVSMDLSTKNFTYPLDGDISIGLHDGNYISEDNFKILTGSQINIYADASLTILAGKHLVFYDEFDDIDNVDNTEYPDRPAALLLLHDGATLNINGSFAGIIERVGSGTGVVNVSNADSLTVITKEANGSTGTPTVRELTFTTKYQYTLTLNYNNGTEQVSMKYVTGETIDLPDPVKTGYDFKGWYLDSDFTEAIDINSQISGNLTLYAKWETSKYTVTFNSNCDDIIESQVLNYNSLVEKPENPTKLGYEFMGWYLDDQEYDFSTPVTDSITLSAEWKLLSYTISYELNGGSNHENNPSQYDVETPKVFLAPSKTGHTFVGWYTDAEFTNNNKITETSGKTENLILYANWIIDEYTVTLDYVSDDIPNNTITADYNSVLNENDLGMDRMGYTLTGWYRDSSYSTPWNFNEDKVINNVTLYAKWEAITYSITYELDEGTNNPGNPASYTIDTETITLKDPARLGYTFKGWYTTSDFSGFSVTEIAIGSTGNITLYAKWEAVEYTVSFVNWDDSEISSKQYHYGDTVTIPTDPERPSNDRYSYTFSGWDKEIANVTEDATYKAVYTETPIDYTISYELNGGNNNQSNPDKYNCETDTITLKDPTRLGYTFKGWYTTSDFSGNKVIEIVKGSTGNKTLYASWEILTFSITIPTSDDYTISYEGSTTVNYGSNFEFTITVDKMYDINKVIVKSNGVVLTKSNEKYVIENITENQTISVEGIEKNSYNVTISQGDGFTLTPSSNTVAYGDNVTFTFTLDEAYSQSEYTIKQNGSVVTLTNNQFMIETVTSDINITVEGVRKNTYSVTFEYDNGSPSATETITHGDTVTKPTDPTKEGYTFAGWTLNGNSYEFNTPVTGNITLKADWTPITYKVQFNGNGSTSGSMSDQTFTYDKAQNLAANEFVKTGHEFAGWSVTSGGPVTHSDNQSVSNLTSTEGATITLYAVWTPKSYTIQYDNNGGSGSITNQNITYGSEITLSDGSEFSKNGHHIVKWNTQADGNGTDYELNKTFQWNIDGDLNLYAVWEIITYNITYELNEGTNNSANPASYTVNTETITLKDPTRLGYTFKGWYTTSDFSGNKVTEIVKGSTGNKTLYAQWEQEQYLITFNANGGIPQPSQKSYKVGDDVTIPTNLSKNGYRFEGWYTDADCTQSFVYSKGTTTGNITLYAKWTPIEYQITYELNGGTVSGNPDKYTIESETITINNPTKTGYIFAGWSGTEISETTTNLQIQNGSIGARTYTANWTPITYKVQFDGNESTSGSMSDQTFTYDKAQNLAANEFVKTGHEFAGWSYTLGGSVRYADSESVNNLTSTEGATITLYAVWSINHYSITLPTNDVGVAYNASVVDGYNISSVEHGKDFKFTITFESSIGNNSPVIAFGDKTISGTTSDNLTFEFTISNVTDNLNFSLQLVPSLENALKELVNQDTSNDYKLILEGTTLTVSIINPNADVSDLIGKISAATSQEVPVNPNSGRTGITSFLAYLPNDDTLWADNLADYTVNLAGCTIVFKQDADAVKEAKIRYLTEIAQAVRVFRSNPEYYPFLGAIPEILSTSVGIENNGCKYIDIGVLLTYSEIVGQMYGNDGTINIMVALMTNYSTVVALVGHQDAKYGKYDLNQDFTKNKVALGKDLTNMNEIMTLYQDALSILNDMGIPISTINDPIKSCFDNEGNGYGGYGQYYCISSENGLRYTDIYHLKFSNRYDNDVNKISLHNLNISDDAINKISLQNFKTDNSLIYIPFDFGGRDNFSTEIIQNIRNYEYTQLVSGELVVINIDASSGYTINDIQVTSTSGEIKWYNSNSFIMPDGDVTISLRTSSEAEIPTITKSPSSPVNMTVGDSKSLTVSASVTDGGILSYAWYAADGPSDTTVEETKKVASSATYTIPADKPEGVYYYFCVVTNTFGTTSSTSTSSIVTVQITAQTYSISFETNGGSAVDAAAYQNLKQGTALSLPSSEKFGYQFAGWYSDMELSIQAPTVMPANNLTLYAKWNNVLSSDGSVTVFENVGDKPWLYDEQNDAYHSSYLGVSNSDDTTTLPEFSVTLTGPGVLSFDYMLKSNKAFANITQDALCYKFSKISIYVYYSLYSLSPSTEYLNGTFAVTDSWSKASVAIDAAEGESVTVYFAYAKLADDSTEEDGLWIKNLSFSLADMHLKVDSNNSEYGTISATSGDQELAVGSENMLPSASAITLSAVPNAGYKFYCWVDENNNILSTDSTYSFSLVNNLNITAVFGSKVETQYVTQIGKNFYTSLEAALADAKSGDKLTLLKDYEMTSDATVKSGVFLLLPCMDNDVGYASNGYNPNGTKESVKDQYRTLTIPQNVTLTIEGSVLINAVTGYPAAGDYNQDVRGGYAQINLDGNIVVNDKGLLDNCGYILGSGQITAKSGAEIRDLYVVKHWDGGSHANGAYDDGIFPFTEYDCHNIQTTLYMESGSSLFGTVKMYASYSYNYTRFPQVDNNNGLIRLTDGAHLIKTYDPGVSNGAANDKGKVSIIIDGGATFSSSTLKILVLSLSTKSYIYPVDGDISFTLNNGNYLVENDFKVLPGCIVTVSGDSTLTTSAGTTVVFYQNTNNDGVNGGKGWDTYSNPSSRYPADRPDAYLQLLSGSKFTANGAFAGFIQADGATIELNGNTSCITKETISISGNMFNSDTQFKEITTTAQIQKIVGGHNVIFDFVKDGVTTYSISTTSELPTISIAEYTFDGWYSGESKIESLSAILEDTSLTAKYILKSNNVAN